MPSQTILPTITCRYSCDTCTVQKQIITVPNRKNDNWHDWIEETMETLQADHLSRSDLGLSCPGSLTNVIFGLNPDA